MSQSVATVQVQPCLNEVEIFQDLTQEEMMQLGSMLPLNKFEAGQILFDPVQGQSQLFIIKSGRVRLYQTSASGKMVTLSILEPGSVFGEMNLLGQSMGQCYAEAMESGLVCQLDRTHIESFLLSDPRIAMRIASLLGRRLQEMQDRLADLVLKPLPSRVASLLLQLSQRSWSLFGGSRRSVRLTHDQLASLAGATREAVSKVLSKLAQDGLVSQSRGRIVLEDVPALEALKNEGG